MDQFHSKAKKKNRKPLYLLLAFLTVFIGFIYFITRPSLQSVAIRELQTCFNVEDVKQCWYKYKTELSQDAEFVLETRNKLVSFNLTDNEIQTCKEWLPPPPTSINLIVVPDLSKRINDTLNNPDQVKNDIVLLNAIWKNFVSQVRLKMDSKDRLVIDVTDKGQAGGSFRTIANHLIFDLSEHKNKSNRLYFDNVGDQFNQNVSKLYSLASKDPIGADYYYYFEQKLPKLMKKSTLTDNYRNVLLILTDGYLEAESAKMTGTWAYTGTFKERNIVSKQLSGGKIRSEVLGLMKPIPDCTADFSDLEVLVIEVNPRTKRSEQEPNDPGTVHDLEILKYHWTKWFRLIGIKNSESDFFIQRNDATVITVKQIEEFLNK
jgi:hypothetical protein